MPFTALQLVSKRQIFVHAPQHHLIQEQHNAPKRKGQKFIRQADLILPRLGMLSSEWYGKLIGAHFDMHPDPEAGSLLVSDPTHPITFGEDPPAGWMDEWYNFKSHPAKNQNLRILLRGDTKSFKGGKHGEDHPLAWCQEFEGGKCAYIALGHFESAYNDRWFMGIVTRGIMWAAKEETGEN